MAAATKSKKKKSTSTPAGSSAAPVTGHYDADAVVSLAKNQWPQILYRVAGLNPDLCDGSHHPCPKCGGTDRFRFSNMDGNGSTICNKCGKNGNGFFTIEWLTGKKFAEGLALVADYLGIQPTVSRRGSFSSDAKADPAKDLSFMSWDHDASPYFAAVFCESKPGVSPDSLRAVGASIARYKGQYTVIAIPTWGEDWKSPAASPVGYTLYNYNGQKLPKWTKNGQTGKFDLSWVKVKVTFGSQQGVICDRNRLADVRTTDIWKLEGPSDLLAFLSLPSIPPTAAPFTTANGAGEIPLPWIFDLVSGKSVTVLGDADQPGESGASSWAGYLASKAATSRKASLPFPIVPTHGKDLRDWAVETHGDYPGLLALPISNPFQPVALPAAPVSADGAQSPVLEAGDDPHYLARVNLARYATLANSATLRYWRSEWYTWKPSRGCYKKIEERELRAKVTAAVKDEFDRQWREEYARWKAGDLGEDAPCPQAKKVTTFTITNVLNSMASATLIPSSVEPMTWLDSAANTRTRHNYMAMANGVLDLDRLIEDRPDDTVTDVLLPHSPNWFSLTRLAYDFDPAATCPRWERFLEHNLELDPERIKLVQEWAGYCLLPDTSLQRFLFLEGRGANGKSVFLAALSAMLGVDNCSHIPLERFGERFERTETLGKLVNICADVGEIDKAAEGLLKSFTSGEAMFFDRRYVGGLTARPTARLIIAGNNRPHFSDRSEGIWRRMIIIPWLVEITEAEKVYGMDNPDWWEKTGELPGIFLWALRGLDRLRKQRRFTESTIGKSAKEEYRDEMNPTRVFIKDNLESSSGSAIKSEFVYELYVLWMEAHGRKPFGAELFGKELKQAFPKIEKKRGGSRSDRYWYSHGISFSTDEICGKKTYEGELFR